jgi:nucleotide-binding universal stress UspA family protein
MMISGQRFHIDTLVAVAEFPIASDAALQYAANLVREFDANARVLYPNLPHTLGYNFTQILAQGRFGERGWRDARSGRLVTEVFSDQEQASLYLHRMLRDRDVDLVLIGWRDRNDASRCALLRQVFAEANIPVLVFGPAMDREWAFSAQPDTILYATDFSPHATNAAQYALSLAQEYQAWLTLLHVVEGVHPASSGEQSQLTEPFRQWMSEMVGEETPVWCETEYRVHFGSPAATIARTARELHADLIVIGRAGLDGVSQMLPGSTTTRVLEEAPCPVLVVGNDVRLQESLEGLQDRRSIVPAMVAA